MATETLAYESAHNGDSHAAGGKHIHVTSPGLLLGVYGALVALTIITVAVTMVDFGELNVWVALLIAVVKASLVALYFMHLRWDSPFNAAIIILSLLFVAVFIGFTIFDTHHYQQNYVQPGPGQTP